MSAKTFKRLPEVVAFVEAIQAAESLTLKTKELPALHEEIASIEVQIREADSDAKAIQLAGSLADKKARVTVLELRSGHHKETAAKAWEQACKLGISAADAVSVIATASRDRAAEVVESLLSSLVDPQVSGAVGETDQERIHLLRQRMASGVAGMSSIARGVWSIRTNFSIRGAAPPIEFASRLLQEIEEVEISMPGIEGEIVKLEAAAAAIEKIFTP